ncbi:MAG: HlyD family efflux transporter periplasmic adaptor subunit [Verrucomicrobiota bacterium]|nr:HlyD family efflux transporter periplasmic adaptor subunit [Verrucomicrobiota bacterium]
MNAQLATRDAIESESEMLPQDPPAWIIRACAWLLISFFTLALVAAILVRLPETVTAPFILVPKDGADPIQSPYLAIVNRVAVTEGDTVKAGAELFVLRSDEIRGLDMQFRTLTEDLPEREGNLAKSDSAFVAQIEIKDAEIAQAETEVKFRERHAQTNRELVERMERLSKNGGISQVELLRLRLDLAESEKDHSVAQRTLQQVSLDRQRMEMDRSRQRGQDVAEIEKIKYRLSALKSDLENSEQNMLSLRAPYDAVVISVAQRSAGSVVQNGQELCQLARLEAKPRARLLLAESGLPKLAVGQRVRFFFEAFPYQRYGAVNAKLDWISPSVVNSPEGPRFVASASFEETSESRTKPLPVRVGMRGEARIVVGRRTMMEYAFDPVRQLRENARE